MRPKFYRSPLSLPLVTIIRADFDAFLESYGQVVAENEAYREGLQRLEKQVTELELRSQEWVKDREALFAAQAEVRQLRT